MKKISIIIFLFIFIISFAFAREITLISNQCNDFCKDDVFYYNGSFNSRLNMCIYEQTECKNGCNSENTGCLLISKVIKKINCDNYCKDDIYYYNGNYNSLLNKCIYEEKNCDDGCDADGEECFIKPKLELIKQTDIIDDEFIKKDIVVEEKIDKSVLNFTIKKGPLLYVANKDIIVIDTTTNEKIAEISLNENIYKIALSPDDSILYATYFAKKLYEGIGYNDHGYLTLINTTTNKVIKTVDLGIFKTPLLISVAPDGKVYISWHYFSNSKNYNGYTIIDFEKNNIWEKHFSEEYKKYSITSFDFNDDGSIMYSTISANMPGIYEIDWNENKGTIYKSTVYKHFFYLGSITATKNAEMLYFMGYNQKKIGYMRTSDYSFQRWFEDYELRNLLYSKNNKALYSIGEKDNKGILNKMTGLMAISTVWPVVTEDFINDNSSSFYTSNKRIYLNQPNKFVGAKIILSPDEKYIYIPNIEIEIKNNHKSYYPGDRILIYNAENLNYIGKIEIDFKNLYSNLAITKNKVVWNPSSDYEKIKDIYINTKIDLSYLIKNPYVIEIEPRNGEEDVFINSNIKIIFSESLDEKTLTDENLIILNSHYSKIEGEIIVKKNIVYFIPKNDYSKNSKVYVTVTDRIKSEDGINAFFENFEFKTGNKTKENYLLNIEIDKPEIIEKIVELKEQKIEDYVIENKINNDLIKNDTSKKNETKTNTTFNFEIKEKVKEEKNTFFVNIGNFFKNLFKKK
jgi:hypothetical protein